MASRSLFPCPSCKQKRMSKSQIVCKACWAGVSKDVRDRLWASVATLSARQNDLDLAKHAETVAKFRRAAIREAKKLASTGETPGVPVSRT